MGKILSITDFKQRLGTESSEQAKRIARDKKALIQFKVDGKAWFKYWVIVNRVGEVISTETKENHMPECFHSISAVQRYLGCGRPLTEDIIRWSGAGRGSKEVMRRGVSYSVPVWYSRQAIQRFLELKAESDSLTMKERSRK